ncbi:hypothetical protein GDO81_028073, partial [Engystomops pustulosus]
MAADITFCEELAITYPVVSYYRLFHSCHCIILHYCVAPIVLKELSLLQTLCAKTTMQTVHTTDGSAVDKLIFRESENDRKVVLQIEKKLFDYFNQEVFRDNNGTAVSPPCVTQNCAHFLCTLW